MNFIIICYNSGVDFSGVDFFSFFFFCLVHLFFLFCYTDGPQARVIKRNDKLLFSMHINICNLQQEKTSLFFFEFQNIQILSMSMDKMFQIFSEKRPHHLFLNFIIVCAGAFVLGIRATLSVLLKKHVPHVVSN